jgi:hypothetical protein
MSRAFTEQEYTELNNADGGICLACDEICYGVEPDAENYTCDHCGKKEVFGIEQALMIGQITITKG